MKRLALAVLCIVGFSTSAYAEKILCVDKNKEAHTVEFFENTIDYVYIDSKLYEFEGENKHNHTATYGDGKTTNTFVILPNTTDWFKLNQTVKSKKSKKDVVVFEALCDNVNVIQAPQEPQLVNNK